MLGRREKSMGGEAVGVMEQRTGVGVKGTLGSRVVDECVGR